MTYPTIMPGLTLDFLNSQQLDPRITYSRASSASYVDGGVVKTAPTNVARFEKKGLLIEESSTNLQPNSEAFATNTAWRINEDYTRGANTTELAPDGTNTACEFFEQTSGALKSGVEASAMYGVTPASGRLTISVYNKPINCDKFMMMATDTRSNVANCTSIVNNTWDYNATLVESVNAEFIGNGWYRMSATFILPTSFQYYQPVFSSQLAYITPADTPDPTHGCTLWGAQVEVGSLVSSYIPTSSSSATRATEVVQITSDNFSSWYNQGEGSFIASAEAYGVEDGNQDTVMTTNGARLPEFWLHQTQAAVFANSVGTTFYQNYQNAGELKATYGFTFDGNGGHFAINGTASSALTGSANDVNTTLYLGKYFTSTAYTLHGHISRISYYNERLTAADLTSLTS